jgi:hypothetical protein
MAYGRNHLIRRLMKAAGACGMDRTDTMPTGHMQRCWRSVPGGPLLHRTCSGTGGPFSQTGASGSKFGFIRSGARDKCSWIVLPGTVVSCLGSWGHRSGRHGNAVSGIGAKDTVLRNGFGSYCTYRSAPAVGTSSLLRRSQIIPVRFLHGCLLRVGAFLAPTLPARVHLAALSGPRTGNVLKECGVRGGVGGNSGLIERRIFQSARLFWKVCRGAARLLNARSRLGFVVSLVRATE